MNGSNAAASLIEGTSFSGGRLPDTVMYEGLEYTITKIGNRAFYNSLGNNLRDHKQAKSKQDILCKNT